jgi:hypothetical protein
MQVITASFDCGMHHGMYACAYPADRCGSEVLMVLFVPLQLGH